MTARLHLLLGLAGSGKSTLARRLVAESPAVRFTLDEWMLRLYPELTIEEEDYGRRAAEVRELIWSIAEQVLQAGTEVVLDCNSWSRERRAWAVSRARRVGAEVVLHRLTTSLEESTRRAEHRRAEGAVFAHPIDLAANEHLAGLLEEPRPEEGFQILFH